MRKFRRLEPLIDQGLRGNKPATERKWQGLNGLTIDGGRLRKRPAFVNAGATVLPGTVDAAEARVMMEFAHLGIRPDVSETIEPNGDGSAAPFSGQTNLTAKSGGTRFSEIDEGAPHDGDATYIAWEKTVGCSGTRSILRSSSFTFPNTTTTFVSITSVRLEYDYGWQDDATCSILNQGVFPRIHAGTVAGGVALADSGGVFQSISPGPPAYILKQVVMATNPKTGDAWTPTEVNDIEFAFEVSIAAANNVGIDGSRITRASLIVTGQDDLARTFSKIMQLGGDWQRMKEDYSALEDIDTANAATPTSAPTDVWDWAVFLTKVYFTNAKDDIMFYPNVTDIMGQLAAGKPQSATIASFASRLFHGDVIVSGVRTADRLQWSKIDDATDYVDPEAGTLELDELPGAIVKLHNFTEVTTSTFIGILVALKELGVYHINATGDAADPFDKTVMNASIGCHSKGSVQLYTRTNGVPVLAFFGTDNGAFNFFEWDGAVATKIGNEIIDTVLADASASLLKQAWSVVDPVQNVYIFAYPTSGVFPIKAVVYDIEAGTWFTWLFPETSTAGQWRRSGVWEMVSGRDDGLAYRTNPNTESDEGAVPIAQRIITGDLSLSEDTRRSTLYNVWVWYRDRVPTTISVDVSVDGAGSFGTVETAALVGADDGRLQLIKVPFIAEGWTHRVRIRVDNAAEELDLERIWLEYEEQSAAV